MIDQRFQRSFPGLLLLLAGLLFVPPAWAQDDSDADLEEFNLPEYEQSLERGTEILDLDDAEFTGNPLKRLFKKWPDDLVVAPVPGYSPQLGWNLKLISGYFLDPKEEADHAASVLGGFVMFSENGSSAYGAGANLHLLDDKLRVQVGGLYADVNYDYYVNDVLGSGRDLVVPIEQNGPAYFASGSWRVWKKLYVGMGYLGGEIDTELRSSPPNLPPDLIPDATLRLGGLTFPIQIDSRDNEQYPRSGWKVDARTVLYSEAAGGDFDAETYKISANHYRPMREQDVLAFRAVLRGTNGDAPFFLLSTLGGSTDLRGYPSGRYRDRYMYAVQSEYRWHFNDQWIFTGFAGFGEVASEISGFGGDILPAAGIGVRFVLSQKHKVSLSADVAVGKDGTEFYFGVGEAF
jgi:outer membrane protein assembly factor BamA